MEDIRGGSSGLGGFSTAPKDLLRNCEDLLLCFLMNAKRLPSSSAHLFRGPADRCTPSAFRSSSERGLPAVQVGCSLSSRGLWQQTTSSASQNPGHVSCEEKGTRLQEAFSSANPFRVSADKCTPSAFRNSSERGVVYNMSACCLRGSLLVLLLQGLQQTRCLQTLPFNFLQNPVSAYHVCRAPPEILQAEGSPATVCLALSPRVFVGCASAGSPEDVFPVERNRLGCRRPFLSNLLRNRHPPTMYAERLQELFRSMGARQHTRSQVSAVSSGCPQQGVRHGLQADTRLRGCAPTPSKDSHSLSNALQQPVLADNVCRAPSQTLQKEGCSATKSSLPAAAFSGCPLQGVHGLVTDMHFRAPANAVAGKTFPQLFSSATCVGQQYMDTSEELPSFPEEDDEEVGSFTAL